MQNLDKVKIEAINFIWPLLNYLYKVILVLGIFMFLITISFYINFIDIEGINFLSVLKVDFFIIIIIFIRNLVYYKFIKK